MQEGTCSDNGYSIDVGESPVKVPFVSSALTFKTFKRSTWEAAKFQGEAFITSLFGGVRQSSPRPAVAPNFEAMQSPLLISPLTSDSPVAHPALAQGSEELEFVAEPDKDAQIEAIRNIPGMTALLEEMSAKFAEHPDGVAVIQIDNSGAATPGATNSAPFLERLGGAKKPTGVSGWSTQASSNDKAKAGVARTALVEEGAFVPDMERRNIMNLILVFGGALPAVGGLAVPYVLFFIPRGGGGAGGGLTAKTKAGDDITFAGWLESHALGDRQLVQGLKGDATYLIVENGNKEVRDYGINAVCTHLGCVVPWNKAANKFMCPCHGSQYDETGKVVRGPAPLSLALAHISDVGGKVTFTPWTETDFRTGLNPWWK
jgi:cytochrome b6-f complex iron-sulfur subunit